MSLLKISSRLISPVLGSSDSKSMLSSIEPKSLEMTISLPIISLKRLSISSPKYSFKKFLTLSMSSRSNTSLIFSHST